MKKNLLMLAVAAVTGASCLSMSAETVYVNETSKVGTSQEAWHGTGEYAKTVTPLAGQAVKLAEHYYSPEKGWSPDKFVPEVGTKPLYQSVSGLTEGSYKVEFYVTAHKANDEGTYFVLSEPSNTINCAYIKVGDKDAVKQNFQSIANNGLADDEPILMTFNDVTIADGEALEMGIEVLEKGKTNWYTIQISSLQRVATEEEALQNAKNALNDLKLPLQAMIDKYQYATNAAKKPYKDIIDAIDAENPVTYAAALALIESYQTQIATINNEPKNERLLAEEDAVLASLNATPITIVNPNADQPEAQDTAWKWYKGGSSDFSQKSAENNRPTLSDGTTINTYFDGWNGSENWRFGVQQNVELEPGEYRLSVMYRAGGLLKYFRLIAAPDHDAAERLGYFEKDNDSDVTDPHTNLSKVTGGAGEVFGNGWAIDHLDFTIEEPTAPASDMYREEAAKKNVCVAAMAATWSNAEKSTSARWASFTHFQLVKKPKDIGSGISNAVVEDVNAPVEYFDLNGIRVNADNLKKGIYIKRQGNKVTKIIK